VELRSLPDLDHGLVFVFCRWSSTAPFIHVDGDVLFWSYGFFSSPRSMARFQPYLWSLLPKGGHILR
jgi:hypothetical protein